MVNAGAAARHADDAACHADAVNGIHAVCLYTARRVIRRREAIEIEGGSAEGGVGDGQMLA